MIDPPYSVIVRAKGPLIVFTITGDGETIDDTSVVTSVENAAQIRLAIVDAILDAKKARITRTRGR